MNPQQRRWRTGLLAVATTVVAAGGVALGTGRASAADCGALSYQAQATLSGSTWTSRYGSTTVYTGTDMRAAVQAAVSALPAGRTSKQNVLVRGSGTISAGSRISLPSYTLIDVCGTINVTGSGSGDQAPIYTRGTTDVEVAHLNVTGAPLYGIFARSVNNLTLGVIDMRLSGGLGVRIDNYGNTAVMSRNIRIGTVYVSGARSHAVETYGVDGITIGTVTARGVGESGLLLNQTINATVGTVDAENAGTGDGVCGVSGWRTATGGSGAATTPTSGSARCGPVAAAGASSASRRAAVS